MGTWFNQAAEIKTLREQNEQLRFQIKQLTQQIEQLKTSLACQLGEDSPQMQAVEGSIENNPFGVSQEELELVARGKTIQAIKVYRERTGADLLTAKQAIDSVAQAN